METTPALEALRTAYRELGEEQKRQICKSLVRISPEFAQMWISDAKLSGWRAQAIARWPAEIAGRLEQALLKPKNVDLLAPICRIAMHDLRSDWKTELEAQSTEASLEPLKLQVAGLLEAAALQHGTDPFWKLFVAVVMLNPEGWLPPGGNATKSAAAPTTEPSDNSAAATKPEATDAIGPADDLGAQFSALDRELELARRAQAFNVDRSQQLLRAIANSGNVLREAYQTLCVKHRVDRSSWSTLEELRGLIASLRDLEAKQSITQKARDRLTSVAEALLRISEIRLKLKVKREAALQLRNLAVDELRQAAAAPSPSPLPLASSGESWLREIYHLADEALETAIAALSAGALPALAEMVSNLRWDDLTFAPAPEAGSPEAAAPLLVAISSPATATAPSQTPTEAATASTTTAPMPVEPANEAPTKAAAPMPPPPVTPAAVSALPLNPASDTPARKEKLQPSPTPEPIAPAPAAVAVAATETVANRAAAEVLEDYCRANRWALAALWLQHEGENLDLPPPELVRLLDLVPELRCADSGIVAEIRSTLEKLASPQDDLSEGAQLLWFAALFPACVLAPVSNAAAFLPGLRWSGRLSSLHRLVQAGVTLSTRLPQCSPQLLRGTQPLATWEKQLAAIAAGARQFQEQAMGQTMLYQPATAAWNHLFKHGVFADFVRELSATHGKGDRKLVERVLNDTATPKVFQKLINQTHLELNPTSKIRIEAKVIPQLEGKFRPLYELAKQWQTLTENRPAGKPTFINEQIETFRTQWNSLRGDALNALNRVGSASEGRITRLAADAAVDALRFLDRALDAANPLPDIEAEPRELLKRTYLCVPDLDVDDQGVPIGTREAQIAALREWSKREPDLAVALKRRLDRKDLVGARMLLGILSQEAAESATSLRPVFEAREQQYRQELLASVKSLKKQLTAARLLGSIGEGEYANFDSTLAGFEKRSTTDDNLAGAAAEIEAKRQELDAKRLEGEAALRKKVETEIEDFAVRERLVKLIQSGDVITATEYIARIKAGHTLPASDALWVQPLAGFTPQRQNELFGALDSGGGIDNLKKELKSGGTFAKFSFAALDPDRRRQDAAWLDSWNAAKNSQAITQEQAVGLLSGLGFVVQECKVSAQGGFSLAEHRVAALSDRQLCPIPRFGSQANGNVIVRHVWRRLDEEALVNLMGDTTQQAALHILIFHGRLPTESRRTVARHCRTKRRSFLILDEVLISHLCCLQEGRLGVFFRAATPYTYADPFVTASSLVPPELFFGRRAELQALTDPTKGRCFLYGGRQLGKTSLLREAERSFHQPEQERYALWLDLLNHGLGRQNPPSDIWAILLREFDRWPTFARDIKGISATPANAQEAILRWLNHHPERRILLLLDEADRFLDEDAKDDFAEARKLKGLMDRTNRRFKVVFAGLHNVQRTTQQANHPLAHLGDPIVVGALSQSDEWSEAFALAAEPLAALGVNFSSSDLVARLLTLCNFYPGLIQQFCSRLWSRTLERRVDGPPFTVTEKDLDEVYQDSSLRKDIVGRFKLTLQLDPRYWVLAYVFAAKFHLAPQDAEKGYTATQLRGMASDWWGDGFHACSDEEFRSLLDEMCHLGVFRAMESGNYSFRNANLLLLLGNKEEVESQLLSLLSGPRKIADYTPKTFRARRKSRSTEAYMRRPLTLHDEGRLVAQKHGVSCVFGNKANGVDTISAVLPEILIRNNYTVVTPAISTLKQFETFLTGEQAKTRDLTGTYLIWVPSAAKWNIDWIGHAEKFCQRLRSDRRFIRVAFEVSSERLWSPEGDAFRKLSAPGVDHIVLRKWSEDFIQPWLTELGAPSGDEDVAELIRVTGGWPDLAQELARAYAIERDWKRTLEEFRQKSLPAKDVAIEKLIGNGPAAKEALAILKKIRAQQSKPDDELFDADGVYAELLEVPEERLRSVLHHAEMLGLIDHFHTGVRRWDPVFERLVLS